MALEEFLACLLVASALLAAWLFARFPQASPISQLDVIVTIVAAAAVVVAVPPMIRVIGAPLGSVAATFLVVLPGCTYLMLSALWLLAYIQRSITPFLK